MSEEPTADLGPIARQQRAILAELGGVRDDMSVLTAIELRLDGTMTALLNEARAMHSRHGRLANRVRGLEGSKP